MHVWGESREIPACKLAEEVVRLFGGVRLRVFGTSMIPAIHPGDLISIERAELEQISPGEIVLCTRDSRYFVHRVVVKSCGDGEDLLITRGDRLLHNDPPFTRSQLIGRVRSIGVGPGAISAVANRTILHRMLARMLSFSDRATYAYLRVFFFWQRVFPTGSAECRV